MNELVSIEFQEALKNKDYDIEEFFQHYQVFEKSLKEYTNTEIAIINGFYKRFKSKKYLVSSPEDVIKLRNACRKLKLKLKVCLDFKDFNKKNILKSNFGNTINVLSEMRNFVVGIHIYTIRSWRSYRTIYENEKIMSILVYMINREKQIFLGVKTHIKGKCA